MLAFAALCLLVTCAAGLTLGARLLGVWSRTKRAPELSLGVTALASSLSAPLLLGMRQLPGGEAHVLFFPLRATGLAMLAVSAIALYFGFWRVFRPADAWAKALAIGGSALLVVWWSILLATGESGLVPTDEGWLQPTLYNVGRMAAYAWGIFECFRYQGLLERRIEIGLAEPALAHRFWLWGWSNLAMLFGVGVTLVANDVMAVHPLAWPAGLFALSASGVFAALAIWIAFFPPRFYARAFEARRQRAASPS